LFCGVFDIVVPAFHQPDTSQSGVSRDLRRAVFQKLVDLPVKYFDTHPAGDIISRICYDIDTVNASLSTDLIQVCTSFITVVGSFTMLLIISPLLSCVFLVTVPISTLFSRRQIRRVHPLFRLRSEKLGRLNGFVEEGVSGQKTVRAIRPGKRYDRSFPRPQQGCCGGLLQGGL
jgi:ATP-binding cassette subfamily B protein